MATKARQQYFADETSLQKDSREFSIADDIQQKINSVETGAQVNVIETVKVNGTALVPDVDKAVNVEVPDVIDNLYSTSTDDALSAKQGKVLYDYIQNIASRGRFLTNWNCATGLPVTNPTTSPYTYMAGDYYSVSNVATGGGTNYRPDGSSYIIGQASTTAETEVVNVSDFYLYDGTNWLLLVNTARQIAVDSSLSTTSTNPVENRVVTNAINGKQDTLIAGTNIQIAADGKTISATDTTYSAGNNISIDANNQISATDTTYSAGTGISIDANNVISSTVSPGATYTAGSGIDITSNVISADTSVVATQTDLAGKQDVLTAGTNIQIDSNTNTISATDTTYSAGTGINIDANNVISSTVSPGTTYTAGSGIDITSNVISADTTVVATQTDIANFFDKVIDDSDDITEGSTNLFLTSAERTILGNTSGTNTGDQTATDFDIKDLTDSTGLRSTWSGKQDALTAGTNIQINGSTISATDTTYTAGTGINIDANNVISSTVSPGTTYTAGSGININSSNVISADTSVVATQTDVGGKVSKGTNQVNGQLFSIENIYGSSTNFGPDYIRVDFDDGTNSGSAGLQRDSFGVTIGNNTSFLTSDRLALIDSSNLTQTTYAEDGITVADNGYGTSDTFEFSGGGNNQIARLKDVKTYTASTGINIDSSNNISNTLPGPTIAATAPTGTEGALWYDTTNDVLMAYNGTAWKEAGTQMKVLSYGNSTWQDFIDAYNENAIVYCRASSNTNPATGNQTRMAFMAYVNSATPTEVEFQYYRSRSDHNTAANQLDQVFVYKLTSASGGTWTVTERNTGAKAVAGTGISLTFGSGNMTIANTGVTSFNGSTGAITYTAPVTSVNGNTGAVTVNEPVVSSTTPSSPTQGMLWYDSSNDVLKSYDGSSWNKVGDIVISSDLSNALVSGAGIRVGDEDDLPLSPTANTIYLCYGQSSGSARLPSEYQEVEYIESGADGNEQNIGFGLPRNDGALYDIEIDVANVGLSEGALMNMRQGF